MSTINIKGDLYSQADEEELGVGSFSSVWKYVSDNPQRSEHRVVAIKFINETIDDEQLKNEVEIHSEVRHPNIVRLLAFNIDPQCEQRYIVMECCRDETLLDVKGWRKKIKPFEMKYYIHQVLKGLDYLHSKKIIHKDIKLQNLLLSKDMQIKICDFGFAMKHRSRGLVSGDHCGTKMYAAPEIYRKVKYTFTVDIWATGVVAFVLLYGYYPFCKDKRKKGKKGQADAKKIVTGKCNFRNSKHYRREIKLIKNMLNTDLLQRPSADLLLESGYFKTGYIPKRLNELCIWAEPKFIDNISMRVSQLLSNTMGMLSDITGNPDEKVGCSSYQSESQPKENQLAKGTVKQKRSIAKSGENISDSQVEDEKEEKGLADESVKRKKAKVTPRMAEKQKKSIVKKTSKSKSSAIEKKCDSPKIETRSTSRDRATALKRRSGLLAKTVTTPVKSPATTKAALTKQIAVKQTVVKKVLPKTVKGKKGEKFESPALKTVLEKSGQSKVEQHKSRYHKSESLKPETKPGPSKKHTSGKSSKTKSCNYPEVLPTRYIEKTYLLDNGDITYELSDGRIGIHFNNHTIMQARDKNLEWIEKDMMFNINLKKTVHFMFGDKIQQLNSADRRLRTISGITCGVSTSPPPRGGDYAYLKRFYTTSHGIVYVLSDGTIQFEHEGEERAFIIICPRNKSITLVEGLSKRWSYSICDLKTREFVIPGLSYLKSMISALHSIISCHK